MGEKTNWEANNESRVLHSSGPQKNGGTTDNEGSNLVKAGLVIAAGIIIAALAKGVKNSDYYD